MWTVSKNLAWTVRRSQIMELFTVRQELRESIRSWAVKFMLHRDPVLTVKQEVEKTVITIWFFWQRTTRVTVI